MKRRWMIIIFSLILLLTTGLFVWGVSVESENDSTLQLAGEFAQGTDGLYVFTGSLNNKFGLYVKEGPDQEAYAIAEAGEDMVLHSPVLTNRNSVLYIETNDRQLDQYQAENVTVSSIIEIDLSTGQETKWLEATAAIRGMVYSQKSDKVYVVGSAGLDDPGRNSEESPSELDLYSLHFDEDELSQLTDIGTYSITSLVLDDSEENAFVIMPDDYSDITPDSIFGATERVFNIELDTGEFTVVTASEEDMLIADVVWLSNEQLIYQAVTNLDKNENYIYDLMYYDIASDTEGEHLGIKEAVLQPTLSIDGESILYMKDRDTYNGNEVAGLYQFHLDSGEESEVYLVE